MNGLDAVGWDDAVAAAYAGVARPDAEPGRVVRVDRGRVTVATAQGRRRVAPGGAESLVTGDWVAVDLDTERPAVVALVPRRSAVVRRDPSGAAASQLIAANLDVLFVVHGLDRPLNVRRLERELVIAFDSGAEPVVVLTKTDRCDDIAVAVAAATGAANDVPVHAVNGKTGEGVELLAAYAGRGRTVGLIGPSGAGKSTLTNRLAGSNEQAVGPVRSGDAKGRHTTTARHLVPIPSGGVLIDTPGLRALALWDAEDGMTAAFPDIAALAGGCRFANCTHEAEPACAVLDAVATGALPKARYDSYRSLRSELDGLAVERDLRARADRRRRDRPRR